MTGRLLQLGHGVEPVLRRLDGDVVADAVARIEIEVGRGLEAAAERDQQALRHVLLGEADGSGAGAVDIDGHVGIVEGLLDARVGGAGNVADLVEHVFGQGAVAVEIGPDDLDVDGRGQAEVENLGHDVDGQHVEGDAGILAGQHAAQAARRRLRWGDDSR